MVDQYGTIRTGPLFTFESAVKLVKLSRVNFIIVFPQFLMLHHRGSMASIRVIQRSKFSGKKFLLTIEMASSLATLYSLIPH